MYKQWQKSESVYFNLSPLEILNYIPSLIILELRRNICLGVCRNLLKYKAGMSAQENVLQITVI